MAILLAAGRLLAVAAPDQGETSIPPSLSEEYQIKSAMLYNFARFIEWPDGALGGRGAPLVIGVLGEDRLVPLLAAALRGKIVAGHPIVVRNIDSFAALRGCHILFLGASGEKLAAQALRSFGLWPALTVGETAEFIRLGGIVSLIYEGGAIHIQINRKAADRAGFKVSSRLLGLKTVTLPPVPRAEE